LTRELQPFALFEIPIAHDFKVDNEAITSPGIVHLTERPFIDSVNVNWFQRYICLVCQSASSPAHKNCKTIPSVRSFNFGHCRPVGYYANSGATDCDSGLSILKRLQNLRKLNCCKPLFSAITVNAKRISEKSDK